MPTYLLHGFRWPRPLIRIHIILNNLEDAAPEWLMAPATTAALLQNLTEVYAKAMPALPGLRFIEQYDPTDERVESKSQPYAFVADRVHEVKLGADVNELTGRGIKPEAWDAMVELRDGLAPGEKLSWFVVVCGDTERWAPSAPEHDGLMANGVRALNGVNGAHDGSPFSAASVDSHSRWSREESRPSTSRSLKKFFGGKVLRKSKRLVPTYSIAVVLAY